VNAPLGQAGHFFQNSGSSLGRNLYFLARACTLRSDFMPPVQDGSEKQAAAAQTAV